MPLKLLARDSKAKKIYRTENKSNFTLNHCYRILSKHPQWLNSLIEKQTKTKKQTQDQSHIETQLPKLKKSKKPRTTFTIVDEDATQDLQEYQVPLVLPAAVNPADKTRKSLKRKTFDDADDADNANENSSSSASAISDSDNGEEPLILNKDKMIHQMVEMSNIMMKAVDSIQKGTYFSELSYRALERKTATQQSLLDLKIMTTDANSIVDLDNRQWLVNLQKQIRENSI
ncbi:hypothetical protein PHYBLDRAFT_164260 [Phycomyces blakesleeanus NRRL 1555(-)]|uniref:No apical meristem-associated C-terminal domain-containing protein n=1 Tax=Phycomyces blakesleeanus (strain ATCC 8743b / DSM 1359 / FGSC 10004 / NBRC 33097 / NRRL 1555) TaxID=763407 RepID=A0A162UPR1_PHYB8|nr:hypothetical protein PHYBLDRAFT_164260 [Phycomyces blakesleeanus NRRL 1555(-)]OAD77342.1 hypothetical protein PHYBLDRAFT_164260 [Phycomyces blakesleeanus NRRL 1555(-)]|eukprot:XP_018295382.1 hypothetical protein PHYBLDRAFT_164260 [Phycomyces blakesleeanus NRRL 1555(-)]